MPRRAQQAQDKAQLLSPEQYARKGDPVHRGLVTAEAGVCRDRRLRAPETRTNPVPDARPFGGWVDRGWYQ